jgi:hypothetical protein
MRHTVSYLRAPFGWVRRLRFPAATHKRSRPHKPNEGRPKEHREGARPKEAAYGGMAVQTVYPNGEQHQGRDQRDGCNVEYWIRHIVAVPESNITASAGALLDQN